jgi:hypothetical protein
VDPVADTLLLRKFGRAGNRTQDLWGLQRFTVDTLYDKFRAFYFKHFVYNYGCILQDRIPTKTATQLKPLRGLGS